MLWMEEEVYVCASAPTFELPHIYKLRWFSIAELRFVDRSCLCIKTNKRIYMYTHYLPTHSSR